MSDFIAYAEDIEIGMAYLEHHQILGGKWGVMNGPPYPLGKGDHSASEKSAAKKAGIKVGSDSGKGSIENVEKKKSPVQNKPKKPKKELTPEEKREKALEAARSGDAKKIAKSMDQLSTEEVRDAVDRARYKNQLADENSKKEKMSKAEMDKQDAIRSGDKEKVKEYADKMSYQELAEAMNKVDLMQRLNYEPPPPSAMDKLKNVANKVDDFRQVAEKGIGAYNVAASIYNSTHKGGAQWPIIEKKVNDNKSKEQQITQNLMNQAMNDVNKNIQQAQQQNQQKSYKDRSDEQLRNAKIDYTNQQKFEKWKEKQEAKSKPKGEEDEQQKKPNQERSQKPDDKEHQNSSQKSQNQYTPERAPQFKRSFFNGKKQEGSTNQEPTEEQKRLVEEARKSDEQYLNRMNNMSRQEAKTTYDSVKDKPISSYDKAYQRDINEAFDDIMSDYNESLRRQQVTAQERQDRAETVNNAKKLMRDALREDNNDAAAYWLEVIRNNE